MLKFYCILPSYMYTVFEKWLNKKSKQGYRLISNNCIKFTFSQQQPAERHYFIFHSSGIRRDEGRFSLQLRYWNLIKTYGIPANKSQLNSYAIKHHPQPTIIEVLPEKIGSHDYAELRQDRRNLYFAESMYHSTLLALSGAVLFLFAGSVLIKIISAVGFFLVLLHMILSVVFIAIDKGS